MFSSSLAFYLTEPMPDLLFLLEHTPLNQKFISDLLLN